ncbi:MAG: DALR domain-containing protein [Gemmatimonadaceae bacterium]
MAQSEAATGKTFARCWCHGEFLLTDGAKMAKRVGNVTNVVGLREAGISGTVYRHFVFGTHYRKQLNMGEDWVEQSRPAVNRIGVFARRLAAATTGSPALTEVAVKAEQTFMDALFDDLNGPEAMAALFVFITAANRELDAAEASSATAASGESLARARAAFQLMNGVLDLVPDDETDSELAVWVEERLAERKAARGRRDFAASDAIRDEIVARGITLEDTAAGTKWSKRA